MLSEALGSDDAAIVRQLGILERQNRSLRLLCFCCFALALLGLGLQVMHTRFKGVEAATRKDEVLRVRGLIVEDANGVERLRLGAPLPDPMGADGLRHKRQGPVSGLIISDAKGIERGGYVTDDQYNEAFLSLDSQKGQEVLFLANPEGGTNLNLFDKLGNEAQLTVFPSGPEFTLKRAKTVVTHLPGEAPK